MGETGLKLLNNLFYMKDRSQKLKERLEQREDEKGGK
jgi:hypothetical protein